MLLQNIKRKLNTGKIRSASLAMFFTIVSIPATSAFSEKSTVFPFHLEFDQLSRILLVNFENDPDTLYVGFEPQVIPLKGGGEAHLVIGWRTDGKVDVYHQPQLSPDPKKYNIAGKGLAHMVSTDIDTAEFMLLPSGLSAHYAFRDLFGRKIQIHITENDHFRRRPISLLAPMGLAASNPESLPCLFLHDFYFVKRNNTTFRLTISGRSHAPDKLPFPIDGKRMFFTRYCLKPVIATFLPAISLNSGSDAALNSFSKGKWSADAANTIIWNDGDYEVKLSLSSPLPGIAVLMINNTRFESRFSLTGHPSAGSISGKFSARTDGETIYLKLQPTGGWKPKPDRFGMWMLYRLAGAFRNWPKYYIWNAVVREDANGHVFMQSTWTNTWKR